MSRLIKVGLIGMGVTLIISTVLYFAAGISLRILFPFFMPWTVLLLIGYTNRRK